MQQLHKTAAKYAHRAPPPTWCKTPSPKARQFAAYVSGRQIEGSRRDISEGAHFSGVVYCMAGTVRDIVETGNMCHVGYSIFIQPCTTYRCEADHVHVPTAPRLNVSVGYKTLSRQHHLCCPVLYRVENSRVWSSRTKGTTSFAVFALQVFSSLFDYPY